MARTHSAWIFLVFFMLSNNSFADEAFTESPKTTKFVQTVCMLLYRNSHNVVYHQGWGGGGGGVGSVYYIMTVIEITSWGTWCHWGGNEKYMNNLKILKDKIHTCMSLQWEIPGPTPLSLKHFPPQTPLPALQILCMYVYFPTLKAIGLNL